MTIKIDNQILYQLAPYPLKVFGGLSRDFALGELGFFYHPPLPFLIAFSLSDPTIPKTMCTSIKATSPIRQLIDYFISAVVEGGRNRKRSRRGTL